MLDQIKKNPNFEPYVAAVDAAVTSLIKTATEAAVDTGMIEAGAAAGSQATAEGYYQPVLWQVCSAALKLHLQVQGTSDTAVIFVPGGLARFSSCAPLVVPCCGSADMLVPRQIVGRSPSCWPRMDLGCGPLGDYTPVPFARANSCCHISATSRALLFVVLMACAC